MAYYCFRNIMKKLDYGDKLYETKVSSLLRFFHVKNIDPSGWLKINGNKYSKNVPSLTRTQIDISFNYNDSWANDNGPG